MEPAPAAPIAHHRFMAPCEIIEPATIRSSVMCSGTPMAAMATIPKRAGAPYCETAARSWSFIAGGHRVVARRHRWRAAVGPSGRERGGSDRERCGERIAGRAAPAAEPQWLETARWQGGGG